MESPNERERRRLYALIADLEDENDELRSKLGDTLGKLCSALDLASHRQMLLALHGVIPTAKEQS